LIAFKSVHCAFVTEYPPGYLLVLPDVEVAVVSSSDQRLVHESAAEKRDVYVLKLIIEVRLSRVLLALVFHLDCYHFSLFADELQAVVADALFVAREDIGLATS